MSNRDNKIPCKPRSFSSCLKYVVAAPLLALTTQFAHALTDSELQTLLQNYEERIKALESELKGAQKSGANPVYIQNLEKNVARIERQIEEKGSSRLKINGFVTAQAQTSNENLDRYGISEDVNFRGNSKAGLQMTYQLNDRADATIQMVARSGEGDDTAWNVDAEWAYIGYQVTDDLKLRAGRLRLPFYMYSDTLEVGYTYPWVKPPVDIYRSPLSAFDGVDMLYNFRTGQVSNRLQVWGGSFADNDQTSSLMLKDLYGASLTSSLGDFSARAMFFTIDIDGTTTQKDLGAVTLPPGVGPCPPIPGIVNCVVNSGLDVTFTAEDKLDYSSIGLNWDNGEYFVIAETTDLKVENGLFFKDEKSGYVSGGMRINQWTPYATYGWSYTINESDFVGTVVGAAPEQSKSKSLGLRRELGDGLAAKIQWDRYYDFKGSNGFFGFNPATDDISDADVLTLSLDAVF